MDSRFDERWILRALDGAEAAINAGEIDRLPDSLGALPLDLFTLLYFDRANTAERWPALINWLPTLPTDAEQENWTGMSGWATMSMASGFLAEVFTRFGDRTDARVLDYGCGWGRMLRLLYPRVRLSNIFAADPWAPSADLLKKHKVHANFNRVDYIPDVLPFEQKFDLIYSYSVLTHLGPTSTKAVMRALRGAIASDGLCVITVRPVTYWENGVEKAWFPAETIEDAIKDHATKGFAFIEHKNTGGGLDDFGSTSISIDYIRENWTDWRVEHVNWLAASPYQFNVFLRPA